MSDHVDIEHIMSLLAEQFAGKSQAELFWELSKATEKFVVANVEAVQANNSKCLPTRVLMDMVILTLMLRKQHITQTLGEIYMELDPHLDNVKGTLH